MAERAREIAWGGISLMSPLGENELNPVRLGPRDMLLACRRGPALELTWGPAGGQPDKDAKLLERWLTKRFGAKPRMGSPSDAPAPWAKALGERMSAYAVVGFEAGLAACAILVEDFLVLAARPAATGLTHELTASVLESVCRVGTGYIRVLGLEAQFDSSVRLASHRFEPGLFELFLNQGGVRYHLARLAPADILLRTTSLEAFLAARAGVGRHDCAHGPVENRHDAAWLTCAGRPGLLAATKRLLGRRGDGPLAAVARRQGGSLLVLSAAGRPMPSQDALLDMLDDVSVEKD